MHKIEQIAHYIRRHIYIRVYTLYIIVIAAPSFNQFSSSSHMRKSFCLQSETCYIFLPPNLYIFEMLIYFTYAHTHIFLYNVHTHIVVYILCILLLTKYLNESFSYICICGSRNTHTHTPKTLSGTNIAHALFSLQTNAIRTLTHSLTRIYSLKKKNN